MTIVANGRGLNPLFISKRHMLKKVNFHLMWFYQVFPHMPLHMHVTQKFSFAKAALLHGSHTQDLPITFFSEEKIT